MVGSEVAAARADRRPAARGRARPAADQAARPELRRSTPTPCAASSVTPGSAPTTSSSRSAPASVRSPSPCSRWRTGSSPSRSTTLLADPAAGDHRRARRRPGRPLRGRARRRAARGRRTRTAADRAGREPALQRLGAGAAAPAHRAALAGEGAGHGPGRGGRPAGRPPGLADLRHPVGQGRLVRRRTPSRRRSARNVFWPAPNVDSGLVAWTRREPPATTRHPRAGVRGRRRRVRPAPQDAARRPARAGRVGRRPPRRRCAPPASTRPRAARCSTWRRSRGSRRPSPRRPWREHHGPRARPRSTSTSASGRRARTASTRSSPSTRRSGSATTSPRRPRRAGPSASPCRDWIDPDAVPVTGDNIVDRAARAAGRPPRHRGRTPRSRWPSRSPSPAAWPAARPTRRPRWSRCDRLWGLDDLRRRPARGWPPSWAATCRSPCVGGTALGTGRGELVEPVADPATWWWVVVAVGARACPRPRSTGASTSSTPDAPTAPSPRPTGAAARARHRRPGRSWPARCTTTSRPPRCDLRPDLGRPARARRARAARCAGWCPARARPASSSPPTPTTRATVAGALSEAARRRARRQRSGRRRARGHLCLAARRTWSTSSGCPRRTASARCSTDVSLGVAAGRADRRGGPQRRRQDHAAAT